MSLQVAVAAGGVLGLGMLACDDAPSGSRGLSGPITLDDGTPRGEEDLQVDSAGQAAEAGDDGQLTFPDGLPGFPDDHRFVLVRLDEYGVVYALRSLDTAGLRLFVVPPAPFYPDYAPEVDDSVMGLLELADPADAQVLLVLTPGETADRSTVNLLAPIIVNTRTRRAAQVVLDAPDLPLRAPLAA